MDWQNLAYAVIQVAHNFGAVAVVGGALFALWPAGQVTEVQRRLAWLVAAGWAVQGASGAAFGAVSFYNYGHFPDIHGIAIAALGIKMLCAASGFLLAADFIYRSGSWDESKRKRRWQELLALGATALSAAAFLRWFS